MNLGEALVIKARELGIKHFGDSGKGGRKRNARDEEILAEWKQGYARRQIAKRLHVSLYWVRKITQEYEAGRSP